MGDGCVADIPDDDCMMNFDVVIYRDTTVDNMIFYPMLTSIAYTPVKGVDYWTDEDKAEIKAYVDEAILGGEW
jgi:hypothetical protein